jgi:ATPase
MGVLDEYFDERTMSVHLRDGLVPMAKRGRPGAWVLEGIHDRAATAAGLQDIHDEILKEAQQRDDSFVEIERVGSVILMVGDTRVVMTKPPFSDGWEITAVRAIKKLKFSDYDISDDLRERLSSKAEGVLIAGKPGEGKSTFARALAEHVSRGKVVKTIESPRDMALGSSVTQFALSQTNKDEIRDVLLLSRPDYTFFDEMRNTDDFTLYSDLRLAGIGMVGVVHATQSIDALQRFVGKIELGMIPHIVDTIVFIEAGSIGSVLDVKMTVKIPTGMVEADLARPVIEVRDTGVLVYELYSYGEQTVVVSVTEGKKAVHRLAEFAVKSKLEIYSHCEVEMVSDCRAVVYVPEKNVAELIGVNGEVVRKIEQQLGISVDVRPMKKEVVVVERKEIPFEVDVKNNITFIVSQEYADHDVVLISEGASVVQVKVGKKGTIRFKVDSDIGEFIVKAISLGKLKIVVIGKN